MKRSCCFIALCTDTVASCCPAALLHSSPAAPRRLPSPLQGYGLTETCAATFVSYPDTRVRRAPATSMHKLPASGQ